MGPSGSGKSTLMHASPASTPDLRPGLLGDTDLTQLNDKQLTRLRRDRIGFVFQAFNLMPTLTALENITLPLAWPAASPTRAGSTWSSSTVGLRRPPEPPAQRALGRPAAAGRRGPGPGQPSPRSSSPTSRPATSTAAAGAEILDFMRRAVRELGQTIVMVTHDPVAAPATPTASSSWPTARSSTRCRADRRLGPRPHEELRRVDAMFELTAKDLWAHKLRLCSTGLAVVLGVAFMAGTMILTDTMARPSTACSRPATPASTWSSARAAVDADDGRRPGAARCRDARRHLGASTASRVAAGYHPGLRPAGRRRRRGHRQPATGAPPPRHQLDHRRRPQPLLDRRGPRPAAADEVVIDGGSAEASGWQLGDTITVLAKGRPRDLTSSASPPSARPTVPAAPLWPSSRRRRPELSPSPGSTTPSVVAADGVQRRRAGRRHHRRRAPPALEVITGEADTAEKQSDHRGGPRLLQPFLLAFAYIALFVARSSSTTPSRSSSPSVPRRWRCCGRSAPAAGRCCVGAARVRRRRAGRLGRRPRPRRAVAVGLRSCSAPSARHPRRPVVITTATVVISAIVGVSVTRGLGHRSRPSGPAGSAPIAAMRDVALDTTGSSVRRALIGSGRHRPRRRRLRRRPGGRTATDAMPLVGLGASLVFVGVFVLGPVIARPLPGARWPLPPALNGSHGRLARENAKRNPKRTAATASALMIGVALVGFITILAASTKDSVGAAVDRSLRADYVLDSGSWGDGGFSPELGATLAALPEVDGRRRPPHRCAGRVDGRPRSWPSTPAPSDEVLDLDVTSGASTRSATGASRSRPTPTGVTPWPSATRCRCGSPDRCGMTSPWPPSTTTVPGLEPYVIGLRRLRGQRHRPVRPPDVRRHADGVDAEVSRGRHRSGAGGLAQRRAPGPGGLQGRHQRGDRPDAEPHLRLLALAVIIALIGIANTLALSVFERSREIGLLRAVGMSRSQVRRTVRWEAVTIALLGTALGIALGVGAGRDPGAGHRGSPPSRSRHQLGIIVGLAALAGCRRRPGPGPSGRQARRAGGDQRRVIHPVLQMPPWRPVSGRHGRARARCQVGERPGPREESPLTPDRRGPWRRARAPRPAAGRARRLAEPALLRRRAQVERLDLAARALP